MKFIHYINERIHQGFQVDADVDRIVETLEKDCGPMLAWMKKTEYKYLSVPVDKVVQVRPPSVVLRAMPIFPSRLIPAA